LLKLLTKALTKIKESCHPAKTVRGGTNQKRLLKNPLFYFALVSVVLFWGMCASCGNSAGAGNLNGNHVAFFNSFFSKSGGLNGDNLFFSKASAIALETPDLKIIQNNTVGGISAPSIVSGKTLGDVFGGTIQDKKNVADYTVQPGDTLQSIADAYGISVNTLLWANSLTSSSVIKVGQSLIILPTDGVLHVVKSGDTVSGIAQTYKSQVNDIISYNDLATPDVYIGDILIVPGGTMPKAKVATPIINNNQVPLASNYFIFPTQGRITQGLHYYNAIDVANSCGTSVYAAASGKVQRAVYNNAWNAGMGNYVTILHPNGTATYYGHLSNVFVKPGDPVTQSDRIGLIGNTGNVVGATGCHLHFQVIGATNPLAKYPVGTKIHY